MLKKAGLYESLENKKVRCIACSRKCVIPEGSNGFCFVRKNIGGSLYLLSYAMVSALQLDPIEKKPFYNFNPGAYVLGVGTSSCNLGCLFCQNHNISKEHEISGIEIMPDELINLAISKGAQGIAFTYNEPTIFIEYALDVAEQAHRKGLFTLFVSNGYMTKEAIDLMVGAIDAVVVDFKGNGERIFSNKFEAVVSNDPVKESVEYLVKLGFHVEITDLIVPNVGDSLSACDKLTSWLAGISKDIPIHFTRFYPDYKMLDYPITPIQTLEKHYNVAVKNGLRYVYIGNVPGNEHNDTSCPGCGKKIIKRDGFYISKMHITNDKKCRYCRYQIKIDGKLKSENKHVNAIDVII
ncbi:MAG: AmmeMemoRadiSam system radical SAM enzyme [Candidatus Marsarchaeota archaeon]|jgi:pyruvate formate lyase activating enzyme|nr:AmmeMemoRadiSam system radical SAM enzyme [Candidatus Marsarchaeota archaeon]